MSTTIPRYVLETCSAVAEVLRRAPSSMAYNITLADSAGRAATAGLGHC